MPSYVDSTGVTNLTSDIKSYADATYPANAAIADTYSNSSAYAVGDFCIHGGLLYKCNTAIASGGETWTAAHWTQTSASDEFGSGGGSGKVMLVTVTYSSGYVSDTSYDDILAAVNDGYVVALVSSNNWYYFGVKDTANNRLYFYKYSVSYDSVVQYYFYIYKSNGATKVSGSSTSCNRPDLTEYKKAPLIYVRYQEEEPSHYYVDSTEFDALGLLTSDYSSLFPILRYQKSSFYDSYEETGSTDEDYEDYKLVKFWTTHTWDSSEWTNNFIAHALFATTVVENGSVKYKTFLIEGELWNDYITDIDPVYSETTIGLAPSASGVSF